MQIFYCPRAEKCWQVYITGYTIGLLFQAGWEDGCTCVCVALTFMYCHQGGALPTLSTLHSNILHIVMQYWMKTSYNDFGLFYEAHWNTHKQIGCSMWSFI